jgi:hypothetical protein
LHRKTLIFLAIVAVISGALLDARIRGRGPSGPLLTFERVRGEPAIPIRIAIVPLNDPSIGRLTRFRVDVESGLDPDLVQDIHVEYDLPNHVIRPAMAVNQSDSLNARGQSRLELGIVILDSARYAIKARVIVRMTDGRSLTQTAVHWVDLGDQDAPQGMVGRVVDRDGTGIRIYQGVTVRGRP